MIIGPADAEPGARLLETAMVAAVRFVCTDRGQHGSREIALLGLTNNPDELEHLLSVPGMTPAEAQWTYAQQQFMPQSGRLSRGRTVKSGVHVIELPTPAGSAARSRRLWRFPCPTCGPRRVRELRDEKLQRFVQGAVALASEDRRATQPSASDLDVTTPEGLAAYQAWQQKSKDVRRVVIDVSRLGC